MPNIDITRQHNLGAAHARTIVDGLVQRLQEKFGVAPQWQGDTVQFRGTGVDGSIQVAAHQVRVQVRLGLLLSALKPKVESEIQRQLDAHFPTAA